MLKVQNLNVYYGEAHAVRDANLEVRQGEFVAVVGPNGAGKTTIINSIVGLVRPRSGSIIFDGRDITGMKPWERTALGIGLVPEGRRVFPGLTVAENLELASKARPLSNEERNRTRERIFSMFPVLSKRSKQLASTLSGGEQQMLAIARALMIQPRLLLVDEMSTGLMPRLVAEVFDVLVRLRDEGMTILLVEQNARKTLSVVDRAYVLEVGQIVAHNTGEALKQDPHVQRAYLGLGISS